MFTQSVFYWWNSVSLNRSLAFISTMSFSEDLLCLCGYFFSLWCLTFYCQVFWVAWRELSIKMIDTETAFAPCLCVGSFPSVHSCVPLSVPAAHGTNKSVTAACEKSRSAVCMCVWPEGMWHLIPQTRQQKQRSLKPAVLPELNPVWLCDPSMGGSSYASILPHNSSRGTSISLMCSLLINV